MAAVTISSDFGARKNKICHCFHCFPTYLPWSDGAECHDLCFFECWVLSQLFHSPLSLSSRGSLVFFAFCHKGDVICISEVIDISPSNLDSSLCFIQPGILHDVLCIYARGKVLIKFMLLSELLLINRQCIPMVYIRLNDRHPVYFLFSIHLLTTAALTFLGYTLSDLDQVHLVAIMY